jgi:hypothetical protein
LTSLLLVTAKLLDRHERSRAEELVSQIKLLSLGVTAFDAKQLMEHFGGRKVEFQSQVNGSGHMVLGVSPCSNADAVYNISLGPTYRLNRVMAHLPGLNLLGLHPWDVAVSFFFKSEQLICFSETVRTWQPNGDAIFAQAYMILFHDSNDLRTHNLSPTLLRGNIHRLEATVSYDSTKEDRQRAFTVDLRCLTTSPGCICPGEIMPLYRQSSLQTSAPANP